MALDPKTLPNNPELLRQMVVELTTQLEANERRLARIQHLLEQLLQWRYGQKREKIDENQLFLFAVGLEASGQDVQDVLTEIEQDQDQNSDQDQNGPPATGNGDGAKRRGHGRQRLPKQLRRERIEYELKEDERQCPHCAKAMPRIGEEVSEQLEYVPARWWSLSKCAPSTPAAAGAASRRRTSRCSRSRRGWPGRVCWHRWR